jgi:hypothetical protein
MTARLASAFVAVVVAFGLFLTQCGAPAIAGPFSNLAGDWTGGGKLSHANGTSERLRCRASYSVGRGGDAVDLSIRCASDSYKIDLTGYMASSNGAISGKWSEPNYNAAGDVTGRVSGSNISALAIGNTFSARLSIATGANSQSIAIQPDAAAIRNVSISFRRR